MSLNNENVKTEDIEFEDNLDQFFEEEIKELEEKKENEV